MSLMETVMDLGRWGQAHPTLTLGAMGSLPVVMLGTKLLRGRRTVTQTTHGSAHWASLADAARVGLCAADGAVLGDVDGVRLHSPAEAHVCLCAPTRSGKGVSVVIPTLLEWPGSVVVLDPKAGENYNVTGRWRGSFSDVYAFRPYAAPLTCINIVDSIRVGTIHEVGDARVIARSLTAPEHGSTRTATTDHFWDLATFLLTATLLYVAWERPRILASLGGAWQMLTQEHKSMKAVLATLSQSRHYAIRGLIRALRGVMSDREMSGVWSTTIRPLALYSDPRVRASTERSTVDITRLQDGERPISLYLLAPSPDALTDLHPLYRVILDVGLARLTERPVRTWQHRLLLVADELASYGYVQRLDTGIATHAGYGITHLVVLQDLEQLWKTFGKDTAIWGNCTCKMFMAPANDLTARRLSDNLMGKETVASAGTSRTGGMLGRETVSTHAVGRPLLTADELMRLDPATAFVQQRGCQPLQITLTDYRKDTRYAGRWVAA